MPYTEFCCRSGGSNLNAGTRTGSTTEPGTVADFTYASGSWVASTGVFTVASGNPLADGVVVGDFASVYADGATVTTFVGRVTARDATTITVSTTVKAGATTDGTNNRTLKIGGAWQGPNGAEAFPFPGASGTNFATGLTNAASDRMRINLKGVFNITATLGAMNAVNTTIQGYSSQFGDSGSATIDGGTSGASYRIFAATATARIHFKNLVIQNNGATGNASAVGGGFNNPCVFENVIIQDVRGSGFGTSGGGIAAYYLNCTARRCNQSDTSGLGGFEMNGGFCLYNCESYNNKQNGIVFLSSTNHAAIVNCIIYGNTLHGIFANGLVGFQVIQCDLYNNGGSGIFLTTSNFVYCSVVNTNFLKNTAWGIQANNAQTNVVVCKNCAFGTGTMANGSGNINHQRPEESTGSIDYANNVSPYEDVANSNFKIVNPASISAGFGKFPGQTIGYPDIGAAQSKGGGPRNVNIRGGADQ